MGKTWNDVEFMEKKIEMIWTVVASFCITMLTAAASFYIVAHALNVR